jgi:uncharacterized membrane-anchored protein
MRATTITTQGLALCVLYALASAAFADAPAPQPTGPEAEAPAAAAGAAPRFSYQGGEIVLPNKVATLHLGDRYRYLDQAQTEKLLVAWGNEPGTQTQGAIIPKDVDPMSDGGWIVVLSYDTDGHVDDSDAAKIDYDDLLKDMQEGAEEHNKERQKAGYKAVHLVGWAEKPHYDATNKKLYWAKEFQFDGATARTLNYDVRILGREGVLSMNAVAGMEQLPQIKADMQPLIRVAEFNDGHRYAEFNSKTDRMAEYGLGALIAGGVAAKLGLFAKIGALLAPLWKFIIAGFVALGGFIGRLFGKKKDASA